VVATVPAGATTGPITVTTPFGSATSSGSFVVLTTNGVPTITSFNPTIGVTGTAITVTGTNFESTLLNNRVDLNGRLTTPTTANPTTVATTVPGFAMGGPISVATPLGTAISTADFFVPPSPYGPADVILTDRLTLGTNKTVTIGTSGKIGLVLFDAIAGQHASFLVTSSTIGSGAVTIYRPDGVQLATGSTANNTFIDSQTLPLTGAYTIMVDPASTLTGALTLTSYALSDVTGSITSDGTGVPVTISAPGQNGRLTFSGTAGQIVSAWATSTTWTTCSITQYYLSIIQPDGSTLSRVFQCNAEALIDHQVLPMSGTYTLMLDPDGTNTGSATLRLYAFTDVTGPISADGTAVPVTISAPGQDARFTFSGTPGQVVSAWVTSTTWQACSTTQYRVYLLNPDGSQVGYATQCDSSAFIEQTTLTVAGTYTVRLDPEGSNTGLATVGLYTVVDITGPIVANGAGVSFSITTPGQDARLTFDGTAGQVISVSATSSFANCSVNQFFLELWKPDGSRQDYAYDCWGGAALNNRTLPLSGVYTVKFNPVAWRTGSATVTLRSP
jgi:hypothetical protein